MKPAKVPIVILSLFFCLSVLINSAVSGIIQLNKSPNRGIQAMVETENNNYFSTTYTVDIPAVHTYSEIRNGKEYTKVYVHGFSNLHEVSRPDLPSFNYFMVTPLNGRAKITILHEESQLLENILVHPKLEERLDGADDEYHAFDVEPAFETDNSVYSANAFFPTTPTRIIGTSILRGVPLSLIQICPVLHNPVTKQIKVYTKLTVKVEFFGGIMQGITSGKARTIVERLSVNGTDFFKAFKSTTRYDIFDDEDDYLILTTDEFEDEAKKLAHLKRMQGYDTKITTRSSWSTSNILQTTEDFYDNNNKAEYFLIIGDHEDLPGYNDNGTYTDLEYSTVDGSDYHPDIAHGRLPVENTSQARTVIDKVIKYQKDPPNDADFFNKMVGAAYFQDNNDDDYEDRRYSLTLEELILYLKDKDYETERIYYCSSSDDPKYRNDGSYAFGQKVPDYLRKPTFKWDGGTSEVIDAFNKGTFVVMHRDHGSASGWSQPKFRSSNVASLRNGDLLPLVFSLNCTTGKFSGNCFSEALIRKENGGCVAVYGAANTSPTGPNCALCHGLTDAFWPGTAIHKPSKPKPDPPNHPPIYTIGDALTHGLLSQEKYWSKSKREFTLYQCFGDPAMELTTANPVTITANHDKEVGEKNTAFGIGGLNVIEGIATLYNEQSSTIIGRVAIKNDKTVAVPISKAIKTGDKLTLFVWGHNFRPHIQEVTVVDGSTNIFQNDASQFIANSFSVSPRYLINKLKMVHFTFTAKNAKSFKCSVFDIKGNKVIEFNQAKKQSQYRYTMGPWNLSNQKGKRVASGTYFVRGEVTYMDGKAQIYTSKLGIIE